MAELLLKVALNNHYNDPYSNVQICIPVVYFLSTSIVTLSLYFNLLSIIQLSGFERGLLY